VCDAVQFGNKVTTPRKTMLSLYLYPEEYDTNFPRNVSTSTKPHSVASNYRNMKSIKFFHLETVSE
jgi:hypothetical protein